MNLFIEVWLVDHTRSRFGLLVIVSVILIMMVTFK